jgi:hypothetical protein
MSDRLKEIRERNDGLREFIAQQRAAFKGEAWWRENAPPITASEDIVWLIGELMRNTCGCGHALADHHLSTGAVVVCPVCLDDEGQPERDCYEDNLRANNPRREEP